MNKDIDSAVELFTTKAQKNNYRKLRVFWESLININKSGAVILVDGEMYGNPYIDSYELGFKCSGTKIVFVGCSFSYNKKTGEYDLPWIDITEKEIRKRIEAFQRIKI